MRGACEQKGVRTRRARKNAQKKQMSVAAICGESAAAQKQSTKEVRTFFFFFFFLLFTEVSAQESIKCGPPRRSPPTAESPSSAMLFSIFFDIIIDAYFGGAVAAQ